MRLYQKLIKPEGGSREFEGKYEEDIGEENPKEKLED